jgi:hypothetical protein
MAKAIARGAPRNKALLRANEGGATWREIGEYLGITGQAASQGGASARRGKRSTSASRGSKSRRLASKPGQWTPARDKRLLALQAAGRSLAEIAKALGTTRGSVTGRSVRLRGIVYRSVVDSWKRSNARRSQEARKRAQLRRARAKKAIGDMAKALARGMPDAKAMLRAKRAGATWRKIGEHFGISARAASERVAAWRRRSRG